ncbi:MAG: hypothetical protein H7836_15490 [Magnetococcus sp. YQC-3]
MMRLKFVCFDFKKQKSNIIYFDNSFFDRYLEYCEKNHLPFLVEDLVSFYFVENGWVVDRIYLQRVYGLDLKITKDNVVRYIEVKSRFDAIKLNQLEFIFGHENCEVIWVLEDETDLRDLMY